MEIYVNISLISIFYPFFWFFNHDLSYKTISLISQLQTQLLMTSHIQYLIQSYDILVLIFILKIY